jgi:Spy/CpxP family protein refolding chaperone
VTGRKRVQLGIVALAACLGGAAFVVGAGSVTAFEQKAPAQPPQVQTPPTTTATPTPSPAQGRGGQMGDGRGGPGRGGPGGPREPFREWEWWKDDAAKRDLGLTDKVAADIDRYYQNRLRAMTPFVEEWKKQADILNQMTLERNVEDSAYAVQVAHFESLNSKLRESRAAMLYHIYRLLTPEQYKKLPDLRDRHFQRGRGGH